MKGGYCHDPYLFPSKCHRYRAPPASSWHHQPAPPSHAALSHDPTARAQPQPVTAGPKSPFPSDTTTTTTTGNALPTQVAPTDLRHRRTLIASSSIPLATFQRGNPSEWLTSAVLVAMTGTVYRPPRQPTHASRGPYYLETTAGPGPSRYTLRGIGTLAYAAAAIVGGPTNHKPGTRRSDGSHPFILLRPST